MGKEQINKIQETPGQQSPVEAQEPPGPEQAGGDCCKSMKVAQRTIRLSFLLVTQEEHEVNQVHKGLRTVEEVVVEEVVVEEVVVEEVVV
jgi:hypothetical protein